MIPWILLFAEAWARAGGGHGYSGGGSSGGGSSGGGSSGGGSWGGGGSSGHGDGDALELLIWLVFRHPAIGLPVITGMVILYVVLHGRQSRGSRQVHRTHGGPSPARPDLSVLRSLDANFSEPLFLDLARLVYTRAHEERGRGNWEVLVPYLAPEVVAALKARAPNRAVRDVVLGATRIVGVRVQGATARITVHFEGNLTEQTTPLFVKERWVFSRVAATLSPGPDRMRALGCPNCGSPIDTARDGRCRSCDAVLMDGRLQWRVVEAQLSLLEIAPALHLTRGAGVEAGTELPLVLASDLPAKLRAFQARHPEFHWAEFRQRAVEVFTRIQQSWSDGNWEGARPFETDFLFQQHRYWIDRYASERLRNRMDAIAVTDIAIARIHVDAYLEAVTVRIFARMRDWTEDSGGTVVGGSRTEDRIFSEYWTFLRSAGQSARPRDDAGNCPSCAAPLDRVSETGICGYCEAKITGGEFDWVLSSIDQDEAYLG